MMRSTLGIDYGTNSVRALLVDCADGRELGVCVVNYPSGHQGVLLDQADFHLARQSPADHLFGLEQAVKGAIREARKNGFTPDSLMGIGIDTTGSSPLPVDSKNVPLALSPKWEANLHAQCWLWKDHTSHREAHRHHLTLRATSAAIHRQMRQHLFLRVVLGQDLALPQCRA